MSAGGGEAVAAALSRRGVRFLFTLIGGHISPIITGAKALGIRIIDVRNEATAVFAADAVARLTGTPGVAAVTAGPGVTNTVTAVKNASMAQSPVIILGGAAATVLKGRGSLQDIDQLSLMKTVAKAVFTIRKNCDIIPVLDHAFLISSSGVPGPVFVECPIDLLYDEALVREWYGMKSTSGGSNSIREKLISLYLRRHVDTMFACDPGDMPDNPGVSIVCGPPTGSVQKAAQAIMKSKKPLLILGSQSMLFPERTDELGRALSYIGVPAYLAGMSRGLLGREHPLLARHHRREALREADCVLLAGMPCDFRLDYGRSISKDAFLISVNRSLHDLKLNRKPDIGIHSDPFLTLRAIAAELNGNYAPDPSWTAALLARDHEREKEITGMCAERTRQVNPLRLLREFDSTMDKNTILIADGGDFAASASYILKPGGPLGWLDPGAYGTLGVGAGFALGAGLCRPSSDVWIIYGDGAAGYSITEFDTFVRHGIPVAALVGNDASWAQIARDQVTYLHDDAATVLRQSDYHVVAEGLGARGLVIRKESEIKPVLRKAWKLLRSGKPVLVNALIGKSDFRRGSISM